MSVINNIKNKFIGIKDSILSLLLKKYINNLIDEYGEMVNLSIDSKNRKVSLNLLLKGEKENILVDIEEYEVIKKSDRTFIKFKRISSSREWIETLVSNRIIPNYAPNNKFEIDSKYASIIELLV